MQPNAGQRTFDREGILKTLWGDPMVRACSSGTPVWLSQGEEFLDLQLLVAGVQRAKRTMVPTGGELSRSSVEPATWSKLLGYLQLPI